MKKILLININQQLIDLYALNLMTFTGTEIEVQPTGAKAISFLTNCPDISLIISRVRIGQEPTLERVIDYLDKNDRSVPIIALGNKTKETEHLIHMENFGNIEGLIRASAQILGISARQMASFITQDYYPIPISHFYALRASVCDVFIKLGERSTTRFLKRINCGENLDDKCLHRYITSGVEFLYVESKNRLRFVTQITTEILSTLNRKDLTEAEAFNTRRITQELISQNIRELGVNDQIIELANTSINSMLDSVKDASPKLRDVIKLYYARKDGFLYKRTQLTTYFGLQMLKATDWAKEPQFKTLAFVSFFHDISLQEEHLARIHSENELEDAEINQDERELVGRHAQESEGLTNEFPGAPLGADAIIRQHHGSLNGIGFSEKYGGNLSPLSIIFIIAEDCANYILNRKYEEVKGYQLLEYLRDKYQSPRFIKIIRSLNDVF